MRKSGRLTALIAALHGLVGMGFSVTIGFGNPVLAAFGFDSAGIGMIFCVAMLASIAAQSGLSVLIENKGVLSVAGAVRLTAALAALMMAGMPLRGNGPWPAGILFCIGLMATTLGFPLLSAMTASFVNAGIPVPFGPARAAGSVGFASVGFFGGRLLQDLGVESLLMFGVMVEAGVLLLTFAVPKLRTDRKERNVTGDGLAAMFCGNPRFTRLIIGVALIFIGHNILSNFLNDIVRSVGGDTVSFGIAVGLCAGLELPTMLAFAALYRRVPADRLLRISGIFMTVKVGLHAIATSVGHVWAAQLTQMAGYALFTPLIMYYVNALVKRENQVKGQMMVGVATMGIGGGLGNLLGGWMIHAWGTASTMAVCTAISAVGAALYFTIRTDGRRIPQASETGGDMS